MFRIAIALAAAMMTSAQPASAHEFWLDMERYRLPAEERSKDLRFLVGDAHDIGPWPLVWEKIVALRTIGPDGVVDRQSAIEVQADGIDGGAKLSFAGEGSYVVAFESHHAASELEAAAFTAYLREDGLTPALEHRAAMGTSGEPGREIYSRRAKALVQVGRRTGDLFTRAIGHTLEIVPEQDPYAIDAGTPLSLRIEYQGRPLEGAKVVLGDLDSPGDEPLVASSDRSGRVTFTRPGHTRSLVSVVWTRPIPNHPRAEFETVFASLAFGR